VINNEAGASEAADSSLLAKKNEVNVESGGNAVEPSTGFLLGQLLNSIISHRRSLLWLYI